MITTKINTAKPFHTRHTLFGGLIYQSDFETDGSKRKNHTGESVIARRIASDQRFDEQCRRNIINRNEFQARQGGCLL